jgi:STAM-binding protein
MNALTASQYAAATRSVGASSSCSTTPGGYGHGGFLPTSTTTTTTTNPSNTSFGTTRNNNNNHHFPEVPLQPLKLLYIPECIFQTFAKISEPNTLKYPRGIETCAVLCGTLTPSKLVVTTLVFPKQKGEADHCEMLSEEELLDVTASRGIVTLGWIHTHPSQDCFLSSMDLHTHLSYQLLLPEAVAIVLAPRVPVGQLSCGIFRLTDSDSPTNPGSIGGLELIQACEYRGFHPHDDNVRIYEHSSHVRIDKGGRLEVIDLR